MPAVILRGLLNGWSLTTHPAQAAELGRVKAEEERAENQKDVEEHDASAHVKLTLHYKRCGSAEPPQTEA